MNQQQERNRVHIHSLVHLLGRQLSVNVLHGLARLLHRRQRLAVDIRGFDRVYLLLKRHDLRLRLFVRVLMLLLPLQRGLGGYILAR